MKKILFLVSGNGGNLKFLYFLFRKYNLPFKIISVIADRQCGAVDFAASVGLKNEILFFNKNNDKILQEKIQFFNVDYIITNVHKILSKELVENFKMKLINLHYSLLPAFSGFIGMKPVELAKKNNVRFIGTTVHYVDEVVDSGKIIGQTVFENNNTKYIYDLVFRCGALNLWNSLAHLEKLDYEKLKHINILSNDVYFSPGIKNIDLNETFWKKIK